MGGCHCPDSQSNCPLQPPPGSSFCQTLSRRPSAYPESPSVPWGRAPSAPWRADGQLHRMGEGAHRPTGVGGRHRPPLLRPPIPALRGLVMRPGAMPKTPPSPSHRVLALANHSLPQPGVCVSLTCKGTRCPSRKEGGTQHSCPLWPPVCPLAGGVAPDRSSIHGVAPPLPRTNPPAELGSRQTTQAPPSGAPTPGRPGGNQQAPQCGLIPFPPGTTTTEPFKTRRQR